MEKTSFPLLLVNSVKECKEEIVFFTYFSAGCTDNHNSRPLLLKNMLEMSTDEKFETLQDDTAKLLM